MGTRPRKILGSLVFTLEYGSWYRKRQTSHLDVLIALGLIEQTRAHIEELLNTNLHHDSTVAIALDYST